MLRIPPLLAVVIGVGAVVVVAALGAVLWSAVGTSEISGAGWAAMIFGVIATLALGIALMSLVFISSRRGYDEPDRRSR